MNKTILRPGISKSPQPTEQRTAGGRQSTEIALGNKYSFGLIMLGAARRIAIAAMVVVALWAMFFWATYTPSAL